MDLTSLYYFSELAKDLHMTRTANRLYISQQTLSNHIQRLEEQLGVKLLYRKPTLSLTCAGEFVLSFADVVTKEYANLKDILSDVEQQERGVTGDIRRQSGARAQGSQVIPHRVRHAPPAAQGTHPHHQGGDADHRGMIGPGKAGQGQKGAEFGQILHPVEQG